MRKKILLHNARIHAVYLLLYGDFLEIANIPFLYSLSQPFAAFCS